MYNIFYIVRIYIIYFKKAVDFIVQNETSNIFLE